ncbi:MAG TPA: cell division protein ZapA [Gemmatirosa sp.]|jgi:cell division protein ZapA|nr:cell division protein ZapA [Gemmatirosa sp.]
MSGEQGPPRRTTSVRVRILDEEYSIRSDASALHTREVAAHVDRVIRQVLASGQVVETHRAAILAALQITDELMREREGSGDLARRIRELGADVGRWLPPAKRAGGAWGDPSADATGAPSADGEGED